MPLNRKKTASPRRQSGALPAAQPPGEWATAQNEPDGLARQQAAYEELLASADWATPGARPAGAPPTRRPSLGELVRHLTGWRPPQPGALRLGGC